MLEHIVSDLDVITRLEPELAYPRPRNSTENFGSILRAVATTGNGGPVLCVSRLQDYLRYPRLLLSSGNRWKGGSVLSTGLRSEAILRAATGDGDWVLRRIKAEVPLCARADYCPQTKRPD
jgi:hypothetical protein